MRTVGLTFQKKNSASNNSDTKQNKTPKPKSDTKQNNSTEK